MIAIRTDIGDSQTPKADQAEARSRRVGRGEADRIGEGPTVTANPYPYDPPRRTQHIMPCEGGCGAFVCPCCEESVPMCQHDRGIKNEAPGACLQCWLDEMHKGEWFQKKYGRKVTKT